jgi:hypothetical protein
MKGTIAHWVAAPNASIERPSGEKPPVGMVVKACATASKKLMLGSMSVKARNESTAISARVSPTYRPRNRLAVSRIVAGKVASSAGPGASVWKSDWRPPTRRRARIVSASTMIPMPPSHWVNWRHMSIELFSAGMSVRTLEPVVVKPDIDSKSASTGLESCCSPERR